MCSGVRACETFLNIFPGWEVSPLDANGLSVGLLAIWNPLLVDSKSYSCCSHLESFIS